MKTKIGWGIVAILVILGLFLFKSPRPALPIVKEEEPVVLPHIQVLPEKIVQGDPILISVGGTSTPTNITFDNKPLKTFLRNDRTTALIPIDLNKSPGTSTLRIAYGDGTSEIEKITIAKREKVVAPLGIPAKLGGNAPASVTKLVETLAEENRSFLNLPTATTTLWTKDFIYPIDNPVVTDQYGYTRQTGSQTISHKGTDFRAEEGTPVKAMSRGIIRIAKLYRNYGNTIVVDHGLGLQTFYMHLSKINVSVGDTVERGQIIGLSGQTGYAAFPHLHLSVRINNISVDPITFLSFFEN
jgi:murein DD-endopeptidase MepM/ murein hydrolase activator NlpD